MLFMPKTPMPSSTSFGNTSFPKLRKCASITFKGIWTASKRKPCRSRGFQHVQVNARVFVASESDIANFACLLRFEKRPHRAVFRKDPVGILEPNHFVMLQEIDMTALEPRQRFIDLFGSFFSGAAIHFRHHECLVPIAALQGFANSLFAVAVIVVPRVVQEINSGVQGGLDQVDGLFRP